MVDSVVKVGVDLPPDLVEQVNAYCLKNPKVKKRTVHELALRRFLREENSRSQ